jgi:small subunit ribosomal protein S17e
MGRIKTKLIKRIVNRLIKENKDRFKNNFEENKKIVSEIANIESKKMRNVIAGYVTRLVKEQKE